MNSYRAAVTGRRNRAAGEMFEKIIENACRAYSRAGIAEIEKTPEPMKPLGRHNDRGQFIACFVKRAQPDYKGTLKGGRAVVFEAKHTDTGKMQRGAITSEQEKRLNLHETLGAECFVLVSFGMMEYFRIPWAEFRDMKEKYGRKYIEPGDVREYQIRQAEGVLQFL